MHCNLGSMHRLPPVMTPYFRALEVHVQRTGAGRKAFVHTLQGSSKGSIGFKLKVPFF